MTKRNNDIAETFQKVGGLIGGSTAVAATVALCPVSAIVQASALGLAAGTLAVGTIRVGDHFFAGQAYDSPKQSFEQVAACATGLLGLAWVTGRAVGEGVGTVVGYPIQTAANLIHSLKQGSLLRSER